MTNSTTPRILQRWPALPACSLLSFHSPSWCADFYRFLQNHRLTKTLPLRALGLQTDACGDHPWKRNARRLHLQAGSALYPKTQFSCKKQHPSQPHPHLAPSHRILGLPPSLKTWPGLVNLTCNTRLSWPGSMLPQPSCPPPKQSPPRPLSLESVVESRALAHPNHANPASFSHHPCPKLRCHH